MRDLLLTSTLAHAKGHVDKHIANIEVYLAHPVGIGEHPDVMSALEAEVSAISHWHDQLEVIEKYIE